MKYIKIFEVYSELDDIYNDVDLIFSYLRDYGYDIYVDKEDLSNFKIPILEKTISIHIGKDNRNKSWISTSGSPFLIEGESDNINELKDCILRLQNFLSDWNFHMEILYKSNWLSCVKNIKINNNKFLMISDDNIVDFPIIRLKLIFTKKIKNEIGI